LPKTLKTLNWFEDFNEEIIRIPHEANPANGLPYIRSVANAASSKLAHESISLEHVSGCYSIDAVPFFKAVHTLWTWPNLATLSLTCSPFATPERHDEIVVLLTRIGRVAHRMP
ncbi:uncharacterized protein TRIVIDRAFT_158403, partial [Trichoderma virens Gv29-8]